jgi:hypothetical protein
MILCFQRVKILFGRRDRRYAASEKSCGQNGKYGSLHGGYLKTR